MARKKRKKKSNKHFRTPSVKPQLLVELDERRKRAEQAYQVSFDQVREVLSRFNPSDVVTAVNILGLWQPNRSSQVKNLLTFGLLLSMPADSFATTRMSTYENFSQFCNALIEVLPDFPMLEDYVPEADWGDVKILLGQKPASILYGGTVQHIIDYMEAFRICHANSSQAQTDLEIAILLQSELLQQIPNNGDDQSEDITSGHIEVPPTYFWEVGVLALVQLPVIDQLQSQYIAELGQPTTWKNIRDFSNGIMTGTALPWLAVRIDGRLHALSLRNTTTVVIEAWAKAPQTSQAYVAEQLGNYLAKRIKSGSCLTGPLLMRSHHEKASLAIAAVLTDGPYYFVVVPVPPNQMAQAGKVVTKMRRIMQDADWAFQVNGTSDGIQIRDTEGEILGPKVVQIVLVSTSVSTASSMTKRPDTDVRMMSLVDACTIFDSIESVDEFARFWRYIDSFSEFGGSRLSDLSDMFGSFRDSHAQIIDGAVVPNFLVLDPHWGASWRYEQLKTFWRQAPLVFPDEKSAWQTHEREGISSLTFVMAKNTPRLAWSSVIGTTTIHFILDAEAVGLGPQDGSLLELFSHIAADSIVERVAIIEPYIQLPMLRVSLHCYSAPHLLASIEDEQIQQAALIPLITDWEEMPCLDTHSYQAKIIVNLAKLAHSLEDVEDARFEADCAVEIVEHLFEVLDSSMPFDLREALLGTHIRKPRFTMNHKERVADVPDFTQAQEPRQEDYKVARRDLAIILKAQGIVPGKYMLEVAKKRINQARTAYRDEVHQRIRAFDSESLLRYCVSQYDAMIASFDREESRIKQSLRHEVDFDREHSMAEAQEKFVRESKNYRYLLECAVVLSSPQATPARAEDILSVQAMIDWLLVLYTASDVLHNDIDVGGLRVDSQYVPEVFYSEKRIAQEAVFGREMAALRLGINVIEEDKITTALPIQAYIEFLDAAFEKDLTFTYSHMTQVFSTLIRWVSAGGGHKLACSYISDRQTIAELAVSAYPGMPLDNALAVVEFLLLKPGEAWSLFGFEVAADDVPVWEHSKRGSRHTIRPLIELSNGQVIWGAASVERANRIWAGSISAGYLPADYPWPTVRDAVGQLKKELEDTLEDRAHEVCARAMPYAIKGIDFKRRFPKERFPNVGDFDVLAYQPEKNLWLTVECKYNQPAFSLKDTRRLRDRIFGGGSERGQLCKIEQRREFLAENVDTLRSLLDWPASKEKHVSLLELYVSKDMHFWLRFPPYEVPTRFVQIDTLDAWLRSADMLREISEP